jgi:hypothetical protein
MCLHPSVRRGGGGLDRPHAAHWVPPAGLQLQTWPGIKPEVKRQFAGFSVWVAALYAPFVGWGPLGTRCSKARKPSVPKDRNQASRGIAGADTHENRYRSSSTERVHGPLCQFPVLIKIWLTERAAAPHRPRMISALHKESQLSASRPSSASLRWPFDIPSCG